MWADNKKPSQFVTIDDCIKLALINIGEEGNHMYNRFKVWCINGYEELGYDVLKRYKQKYLPVNTSTKTALLPDDFVQWLRVGVINQGNEIQDLVEDKNIVFTPIAEEGCDPVPHCSCGCTDPLCAAISNATTTEETISIPIPNYTTYCDYNYAFDAPIEGQFPYNVTIVINGVVTDAETITQQSDLDTFFSDLGFTKNSNTDYSKSNTSDVYGNLVFNGDYCINATVSTTLLFQTCTYSLPSTINFNGIDITLGGVLYTSADVFTSVSQILSFLNSANNGFGFFTNSFNLVYAKASTATATYFGTMNVDTAGTPVAVPAGAYVNNTGSQVFDLSPLTFPLANASIIIDGATHTNNSTLANATAMVAWLNGLGKAKFTLVINTITVRHVSANITPVFTFPTVTVTITTNGVPNVYSTPTNSLAEIVTWLNTQSSGAFGTDGTKIYAVDSTGQIVYTSMGATWSGGSGSTSFTSANPNGALFYIQGLDGCVDQTDTNSVTQSGCESVVTSYTNADYTKTTTICTNDDGNIAARICEPVVTNPQETCTYVITFPRTLSVLNNQPYTNFYFTKNNQTLTIGDVTDSTELTSIMTANGFSLTSSGAASIVYTKTLSADVWDSATFTNSANTITSIDFVQSSCAVPTPTVETVCYDTVVCETETAECGCPTLNNEVVNTIQQWSTLFNEFIQRDLHGLDWQQTFKQPLSWFGYFNINTELGVIQFDNHYPFDTVYLQYYSANEVSGGEYLVPILAREALAAYMVHKYTFHKTNISGYDKRAYQRAYYNEKKKLHERMNPARFADIMSVTRMNPRP